MTLSRLATGLTIAVALPFLCTEAKADTLGVDFSSTYSANGPVSGYNLGYSFSAVNSVLVTGLADFDNGSLDNLPQDQQVGLWDSSGTLLASAFIGTDQGSTQQGAWGITAITGVTLIAGNTYVVGAQGGMGWNYGSPLNVDPDIANPTAAFINLGSNSNSPLVEPTGVDGGHQAYLGGNVLLAALDPPSVPEPATFLLLTPALGALFLLRRKKLF